jgi:hypothetical protein
MKFPLTVINEIFFITIQNACVSGYSNSSILVTILNIHIFVCTIYHNDGYYRLQ